MSINNANIIVPRQYKDVTYFDTTQAFFSANSTVSLPIDSMGMRLQGIITPASFVLTNLTFKGGDTIDTIDYFVGISDGTNSINNITLKDVPPNEWVTLNPAWFNAIKYFKITSTATQTAALTLICVFTPLYQGIHG